jgi:Mrp family chromosome partitioning ATPase
MTAGTPITNPGDVLSSPRAKRLLDELRDRFKKIVIDLPPVTSSIETLRLGQWVDGIVYVVRSGETRTEVAQGALAKLSAADSQILGVVLNRRQFFIPERLYGAL